MDDVVSKFPLLRLPIDAILNTFRIMPYPQIYAISILSKNAKNLVECLKITSSEFQVNVNRSFQVRLFFPNYFWIWFTLYDVQENEPLQELDTPQNIHITGNNTDVTWKNSMSVKQLIDHFEFVFHSSKTVLFFGLSSERFSLDSIHRTIKNIERINIYNNNDEQSRRILSLFRPPSIDIGASAFIDRCVPGEVLIQNFESICVDNVKITLDELLMTNAREIDMTYSQLSVKTLNRFLKLWVKGSNSRMEWMSLQFHDNLRIEELFSGMNYKNAPLHRVRFFETDGFSQAATGGWDFWRFDGTEATITFCESDNLVAFDMFVWHDHCRGEEFN